MGIVGLNLGLTIILPGIIHFLMFRHATVTPPGQMSDPTHRLSFYSAVMAVYWVQIIFYLPLSASSGNHENVFLLFVFPPAAGQFICLILGLMAALFNPKPNEKFRLMLFIIVAVMVSLTDLYFLR